MIPATSTKTAENGHRSIWALIASPLYIRNRIGKNATMLPIPAKRIKSHWYPPIAVARGIA